MKKERIEKGFTLIELLAVIILIGIIIAIAVPAVAKYMKRGTNEYYKSLVNEVKQTGRDYLEDYRTLLPKQIGNVTIVELQELVNNNYIDEVKDENGNICEGRVTAKRTGKGTYEYYTCLKCPKYKTDEQYCKYTESDNTGTDYKNYKVVLDKTVYKVNQGDNFELPFAKVYYDDQLLLDNLLGSPRVIDTSKVGSTVVTYTYHGAQAMLTVTVVDEVKPTKPEVVLKLNNDKGSTYHGLWYSGNIYQKFKSNDTTGTGKQGSGIKEYQISTDKSTWSSITGDSRITTTNGDQTYYVRSIDKSGNISDINSYNLKIDKEAPSCTIGLTGTISSSGWYSTNVGINFASIAEKVSGISYQIISPTSITSNTTGTAVIGVVTDKAGNTSMCTTSVKRDATTPAAPTITASDNIGSGNWHNADTTLTFSGSTSISGINYQYSTDNINFTTGGSVKITTNTTETTYYVRACNNADLCSTVNSYFLKLDKSKPATPTIAASDNIGSDSWHTSNFSLNISGSNNISGITYYYGTSQNPATAGSTISISGETNSTKYYAKACSGANLCSDVSSYVAKLDKTNPTVAYSLAGGNYSTTKTVTITGSDINFSYMKVHVYKDGAYQEAKSTNSAPSTFKVSIDSSGGWVVYSAVYDKAGRLQNQDPNNGGGWYYQTYTITTELVLYDNDTGLKLYNGKVTVFNPNCWQDDWGDWMGCWYDTYRESDDSQWRQTFTINTNIYSKIVIKFRQNSKWEALGTGSGIAAWDHFYLNVGSKKIELSGWYRGTPANPSGNYHYYGGYVATDGGASMTTDTIEVTIDISDIKNTGNQTISFSCLFGSHLPTLNATVFKIVAKG